MNSKHVKIAIAFTIPPSVGLVKENFRNIKDKSYAILNFKDTKNDSIIYIRKTSLENFTKIVCQEVYLLWRIFIPKEDGERDLDDNRFLISQLENMFSSGTEKYKWNVFHEFFRDTYLCQEILEKKEYKKWFIISPNSIFAKLFKLSNENIEKFADFYYTYLMNADILVPFGNFVSIYTHPIKLSYYLSQPTSPDTYANYWLFYFPLYSSSHLDGKLKILDDKDKGKIEVIKKYYRAEKVTLDIYLEGKGLDIKKTKKTIHSYFNNAHLLLAEGSFHLIISKDFYLEFKEEVEGIPKKKREVLESEEIKEIIEKLRMSPSLPTIVDLCVPVLISKIELTPTSPLEYFMQSYPFGRKQEKMFRIYYCPADVFKNKNAEYNFLLHPLFDAKKPVILDTSMLHKDVEEDKYILPFLEYFLKDKDIIIPSISLYETFTNEKWKENPTILIRELEEKNYCKKICIKTEEPISLLSLTSILGKKKIPKQIKEKLNSIRDVNILQTAKRENGVLITRDKDLHKFALLLGIPSIRYLGRKFIEEKLNHLCLSKSEKKKILSEIDRIFLNIFIRKI